MKERAESAAGDTADRPGPPQAVPRYVPLLLAAVYALLAIPALYDVQIPVVILITCLLGATLIALSAIDIATMRLPDAITLPLALSGIVLAWTFGWDSPVWRIASAAAGYGALFAIAYGYRALRGRAGLGLGDAKLFAAAGAWLGLGGLPSVMLWACGVALLGVVLALAFRHPVAASTRFPFGPFLAFGFWMVWLYGPL